MPAPYLKLLEHMKELNLGENIMRFIDIREKGVPSFDLLKEFIINKQIPIISICEEEIIHLL